MKATVARVDGDIIYIKIRRNCEENCLDKRYTDLTIGDKIDCHREKNNPYVVRDINPGE